MIPFFGWVVALWGHVIVRQWPAQAKKAIEKLTGFLRAVPTRELQYEDRMQLIEKLRGIAERELGLNERGDR